MKLFSSIQSRDIKSDIGIMDYARNVIQGDLANPVISAGRRAQLLYDQRQIKDDLTARNILQRDFKEEWDELPNEQFLHKRMVQLTRRWALNFMGKFPPTTGIVFLC